MPSTLTRLELLEAELAALDGAYLVPGFRLSRQLLGKLGMTTVVHNDAQPCATASGVTLNEDLYAVLDEFSNGNLGKTCASCGWDFLTFEAPAGSFELPLELAPHVAALLARAESLNATSTLSEAAAVWEHCAPTMHALLDLRPALSRLEARVASLVERFRADVEAGFAAELASACVSASVRSSVRTQRAREAAAHFEQVLTQDLAEDTGVVVLRRSLLHLGASDHGLLAPAFRAGTLPGSDLSVISRTQHDLMTHLELVLDGDAASKLVLPTRPFDEVLEALAVLHPPVTTGLTTLADSIEAASAL